MKETTYVGLDVHAKSISIAVILPDGELLEEKIANRRREVARWVKRLKKACQGRVVSCYEAGPCGYGLQRQLRELGVECQVVAPSLIPEKRGGERIKTDRRDALKLAQFLAAGMLEEVYPHSGAGGGARVVPVPAGVGSRVDQGAASGNEVVVAARVAI